MRHIFLVASETFLLLRREKIFSSVFLFVFFSFYFSQLAVSTSIGFSEKLLYDFGVFFYHLLGVGLVLFLGNKILNDGLGGGVSFQRLYLGVAPRFWFWGAYLGLCTFVIAVTVFYMLSWYFLLFFIGLPFKGITVLLFLSHSLLVMVLGALSFFFGSYFNFSSSLALCLLFWALGMSSEAFFQSIEFEKTPLSTYYLSYFLSFFWDLGLFHLQYQDLLRQEEWAAPILRRIGQALVFVVFFVSAGGLIFEKKDKA